MLWQCTGCAHQHQCTSMLRLAQDWEQDAHCCDFAETSPARVGALIPAVNGRMAETGLQMNPKYSIATCEFCIPFDLCTSPVLAGATCHHAHSEQLDLSSHPDPKPIVQTGHKRVCLVSHLGSIFLQTGRRKVSYV